jgi:hypothetical protein
LFETAGYESGAGREELVLRSGVQRRLFASSILMFTCLDLLTKFFGEKRGVGARFKEFMCAAEGGDLDPLTADLLWAVRNSLVHVFGRVTRTSWASLE